MTSISSKISFLKPIFVGLCALYLAGCSTLPEPSNTVWQAHQEQLNALSHYTAKGRFAYRDPEQRFSASLFWAQEATERRFRLTSFVGKTLLAAEQSSTQVTLTDVDGEQHIGDDINTMTQQLTGLIIPVNELSDWLIGLPTGADHYSLNAQQRLAELSMTRQGRTWQLTIEQYDYRHTPALPSTLTLHSGDLKMTLQLNQWELK
ncbi:lipoprotein insertase outer membrane protein LolB [Thaumasiovibrio sp. DFM-14]|uniref:lipoprotein insertase outer membrane protein LolB n=1 Tax=Thaumasiovibrio sp. DFM-14 TaxID=3384792 RepID=UPI0039A145B1